MSTQYEYVDLTVEEQSPRYAQDLWQRVESKGEAMRNALEEIEEFARQRGASQSRVSKERSIPMEPRKRTHLVNELTDEARLMMAALAKTMEGKRIEESSPVRHGTHHAEGPYSLEDEHKTWGHILKTLMEIQQELDRIEQYEHRRQEEINPHA